MSSLEKPDSQGDPGPATGSGRSLSRLSSSSEGRILLLGATMALGYVAWLGTLAIAVPVDFQAFLGMTLTHLFFGRAAGISFGYALEYGDGVIVVVNLAIEIILVLLFFPLFVYGLRQALAFKALASLIDRIHRTAEANHDKVKRYGIPGLFLFVLVPFWMTGPLVGSVIGHLLGLRQWLNLCVVLGGTSVAVVLWAAILKRIQDRAAQISPFAPLALVAIIVVCVVLGRVLAERRGPKEQE